MIVDAVSATARSRKCDRLEYATIKNERLKKILAIGICPDDLPTIVDARHQCMRSALKGNIQRPNHFRIEQETVYSVCIRIDAHDLASIINARGKSRVNSSKWSIDLPEHAMIQNITVRYAAVSVWKSI